MNLIRHARQVAVERPGAEPLIIHHIIGIGQNYAQHAREQGLEPPKLPMVFTKNPASAALADEPIIVPRVCQDRQQVDYEAELAVILGRPARDIAIEDALSYVLGYTCANDVSARWWQKSGSGGQFCRGKSFDTFCPLGPEVVPAEQILNPQALRLGTRLNGETVQDSTTADMIFPVARLIAELSAGTTLLPGTIILTGTPPGVGMARTPPVFLQDGDVVEVEVEGIGTLRNPVRFEGT